VLYNIPTDINTLAEQCTAATLPPGAAEGLNDWQRLGYGGPCPPIGRHRYFFKLYALDTMLNGLSRPTKADVEGAMHDHIIAQAQLMGTYQK
jgi:Raf kinase inhibitor-like YbhB/YbcL family protein